jgi:hypothetical protein
LEAWEANAGMLAGADKRAVIETAMKAIMKRDFIQASDEEIHAAIKAGEAELEKAGADFKLQDWSMPR